MLNYLSKNYWWIVLIIISIALILDLSFDTIEIVPSAKEFTNIKGEKIVVEYSTLQDSYQVVRAIVSILYSLGVSIIILVVLDKRIDTEENKRHQRELSALNDKIQNNVFDGVLKKVVPNDLFDQVKKDIFNNDVIRKNAKWTYQIELNEHNSFNLNQTIEYEIENLTEDILKKDIPIAINFSNDLVEIKITSWKVKKMNGDIECEEKINFEKLTVNLEKRESKKIELNIRGVYKTTAVMDNHVSNFSIIGLEIRVQKPSNVEFKPTPSFTTKLIKSEPNAQLITYDKIPCILLGQGISYVIERKETERTPKTVRHVLK
jgi:hypothetical protein